jgi:ribosomal protein L40E
MDIECLRCGARNIVENLVCGYCGANLPVLYDAEGKILKWQEDPYYGSVFKKESQPKMAPLQKGMMFRLVIVALVILAAVLILGRTK